MWSRGLPDGWRESYDPARSRAFYINEVSGHAQWERPYYPASELPSEKPIQQAASVVSDATASGAPHAGQPASGTPVLAGSVAAVTEANDAESSGPRSAVATHLRPSHERKAGSLCVAFGGPHVTAPAARAQADGPRWLIVEDGELFVLPSAESPAAALQLKFGLVGVRGVSCPSELQAGAPHALLLELSPEPRSRQGWLGMGDAVQLVLVCHSSEEQLEWQTTLQRVATAYRNWRRLSESPGAVLGGLKSVGSFALHAAGSGMGWQVGRDAGAGISRAVGLRR